MARKPRVVVPGMPLHVIQRGNNRQAVFFADENFQRYLDDLYDASIKFGCQIPAYVLMTNHLHRGNKKSRVFKRIKIKGTGISAICPVTTFVCMRIWRVLPVPRP